MNYFDTSALVKAFLVEKGTERAKRILLKDDFAPQLPSPMQKCIQAFQGNGEKVVFPRVSIRKSVKNLKGTGQSAYMWN